MNIETISETLETLGETVRTAEEALGSKRCVDDAKEKIMSLFAGSLDRVLTRGEIAKAVAMHDGWTASALAELEYWGNLAIVGFVERDEQIPGMGTVLEPKYQRAAAFQTAFGWQEVNPN